MPPRNVGGSWALTPHHARSSWEWIIILSLGYAKLPIEIQSQGQSPLLAAPTIIIILVNGFQCFISLKGTLLGPSLLCSFRSLLCPRKFEIWQVGRFFGRFFSFLKKKPTQTNCYLKIQKLAAHERWRVELVGNGRCRMGIRIAPNPQPGIRLVLKVPNHDSQKKNQISGSDT